MGVIVVDGVQIERVESADEIVGLPFENVAARDELAMVSLILAVRDGLVGAVKLEVSNLVGASPPDSGFNSAARNLREMGSHVTRIL